MIKKILTLSFIIILSLNVFSQVYIGDGVDTLSEMIFRLREEKVIVGTGYDALPQVTDLASSLSYHLSPVDFPILRISLKMSALYDCKKEVAIPMFYHMVTHKWQIGSTTNARLIQINEPVITINYLLWYSYSEDQKARLFVRELSKLAQKIYPINQLGEAAEASRCINRAISGQE